MTKIRSWVERCDTHPDHNGIVTHAMIKARMQEEIDDLRAALSDNLRAALKVRRLEAALARAKEKAAEKRKRKAAKRIKNMPPNATGQGSAACGASPAPTGCASNCTNNERTEK